MPALPDYHNEPDFARMAYRTCKMSSSCHVTRYADLSFRAISLGITTMYAGTFRNLKFLVRLDVEGSCSSFRYPCGTGRSDYCCSPVGIVNSDASWAAVPALASLYEVGCLQAPYYVKHNDDARN